MYTFRLRAHPPALAGHRNLTAPAFRSPRCENSDDHLDFQSLRRIRAGLCVDAGAAKFKLSNYLTYYHLLSYPFV
jgi:hypothetical protein